AVVRMMNGVRPTVPVTTLASFVTAAALATMLVALGRFNWPAADDFCNRVLIDTLGYAGAVEWAFFQWCGRMVTVAAAYAALALLDVRALHTLSMLVA